MAEGASRGAPSTGAYQGLESPRMRQRLLCATAAAALLIAGLAGCASMAAPKPDYVGVFTGEYVDGRPLYRFPTIEVVATRSGL